MKHEALMNMSRSELDDYGQIVGIDVTGKKTVAQKVEAIEKNRERVAEVDVLGLTLTIPFKRMRDKRVTDLVDKHPMSDADANELLAILVGDEQLTQLTEAATDEDGTVDVDALGLAMARILTSDELKNS